MGSVRRMVQDGTFPCAVLKIVLGYIMRLSSLGDEVYM
jgi:hypothetical protein